MSNTLVNRVFKIWSYTVSHGTLILRSVLKFPDQDDYTIGLDFNIDLEFSTVQYIELPNVLNGIIIRKIESPDLVPERIRNNVYHNFKIFELQSGGSHFYIVASGCVIGKNKWVSEDRVFNMSLNYDEVLAVM